MIFAKEIKKLEDEIKEVKKEIKERSKNSKQCNFCGGYSDSNNLRYYEDSLSNLEGKLETLKQASKKVEEVIRNSKNEGFYGEMTFIDKNDLLKQLEEIELK